MAHPYNLVSNPPKSDGVCDRDRTALVQREDDKEDVMRKRFQAYDEQTLPVMDFFRSNGYRLVEVVGGNGAPEELTAQILRTSEQGMIVRKTTAELEKMRRSGLLVWQILQKLRELVREGVTTMDLEMAAEKMMADAGARPAFKGYYVPAAGTKFPFVLCTSVNEEIVHGMPSAKRVLKSGDIVSIDTGVELEGYYGDSAITVPIGDVSPRSSGC